MRKFYIAALLLTLLMSSCGMVFESEGKCEKSEKHTLVLNFYKSNDEGKNNFEESIDKVDIFLFDQSRRFICHYEADGAELKNHQRATLKVEAGEYRVVCWANAYDGTLYNIEPKGEMKQSYVHRDISGGMTIKNGNPLYYSPYELGKGQEIEVLANKENEFPVRFRAAHIKMNFDVIGYHTAMDESECPYIELTNLYPKYNFKMEYADDSPCMSFLQQTRGATRSTDLSQAKFNTPRFENQNETLIHLRKSPEGEPVKSFRLEEELAKQGIDVSQVVELTIDFEIVFKDGTDVTIRITGWSNEPLEPEVQ